MSLIGFLNEFLRLGEATTTEIGWSKVQLVNRERSYINHLQETWWSRRSVSVHASRVVRIAIVAVVVAAVSTVTAVAL